MGKRGAAIIGLTEWKSQKRWDKPMFTLEAMAQLTAELLADTGLAKEEIDGLCIGPIPESPMFAPAAAAEYLGIGSHFNEKTDLGGASSAGMVMRAAAAIEAGICDTILCLTPGVPPPRRPDVKPVPRPPYLGADAWGSPQQFEVPTGLVRAAPSYALIASHYMAKHGVRPETLAKITVQSRQNAADNPLAIFYEKPVTVDDVLNSKMIVDPLRMLEMVMPVFGGNALLITSAERAAKARHRPVWISGYGEYICHKSVPSMPDLVDTPVRHAAARAFKMAGRSHRDMDFLSIYDCFTITVLLTLEDAGFCAKGEGGRFIEEHDFTRSGDLPLNPHGGQLGFGQQAAGAGGMSHVTEAVRQIQGRAEHRQLRRADRAWVNGTGGMMSEQVALILEGE